MSEERSECGEVRGATWLAGKRAFQAKEKYKCWKPERAWHVHPANREEAAAAGVARLRWRMRIEVRELGVYWERQRSGCRSLQRRKTLTFTLCENKEGSEHRTDTI